MGLSDNARRQKIQADPRNTTWANDKSKFGLKILSKFGWEEGKGLGVREDGVTSHIKIAKREGNMGVGSDKNTRDNWLENTFAFDQILSNLNENVQLRTDCNQDQIADNTKPTVSRLAHRRKYQRAKAEVFTDDNAVRSILGLKTLSSSSVIETSTSKIAQKKKRRKVSNDE